jgi:hypothetical protein
MRREVQNDHCKEEYETSDGTHKQLWQIQVLRELLPRDEGKLLTDVEELMMISEELLNVDMAATQLGSPRLQQPAKEQHDRPLAALRFLLSAQALHRTAVVQQEHWQTHDAHLVDTRLRQGRVRRLRARKVSSYDA